MSTSDSPSRKRTFHLPFSRQRIDKDLDEEFRFHLEERIEQFVAQGMSRADAEAEGRKRFGDYERHRQLARAIDEETARQRNRAEFLAVLGHEVRRSARLLVKTPAFTVMAVAALALGIGATTAIFAVVDAVVLRPLPYPDANRLVSVLHPATVPGSGERHWGLSEAGYHHFRENTRTVTSFGMYSNSRFTVTNDNDPEVVRVGRVTSSLFSTLMARPSIGRLTTPDDDVPGAPDVAVLSHEFHARRFGGRADIVGTMLRTSAGEFEIVGVSEPGLTLPMPGPFASTANLAGFGVDVWVSLKTNAAGPFYNSHPFVGVGRLAADADIESAQREFTQLMGAFTGRFPSVYPESFLANYNFRVAVSALRDAVLGERVPRTLWMLFGAVSVVLLIAAANVANLFMVRFEVRRRESAVRAALGADPRHMAAHFLSETVLLCLVAAILGLVIAVAGLRVLLLVAPTDIPRLHSVALGWRSVAVALGIATLLGALLALLPLLRGRLDPGLLRDAGRGQTASPRQLSVRSALVTTQVALSLILLASAALMLRSFERLRNVTPGFRAQSVLTFDLSLPHGEFNDWNRTLAFHRELQQRLVSIPGVAHVGATGSVPLLDYGTGCAVVFKEPQYYRADEQTPCVATPVAMPGFFEALGIEVEGHVPTWSDVDSRTQAVVVTRALADRMWPDEDPIGKGIGSNGRESPRWYRVTGVIDEIRAEALDAPPTEAVFFAPTPLYEDARYQGSLNNLPYMVHTSGVDPISVLPAIRQAVAALNPLVPISEVQAMADIVERSMARTSFLMLLLGISASIALCLSVVGIYGVISYLVAQRRGEIGIRMALGASANDVVRMVVLRSVRMTTLGVVAGLLGAAWVTKGFESLLYDVRGGDPVVLASVAAALVVVSFLASAIPARRAARVDPVEALRGDT